MSKTTFTYIVMKNRRIGVLPPGSYTKDNPKFYDTEPEAIEAVLACNVGRKLVIMFDDSCFNGKGSHATFEPNAFRRTCLERQKSYTPARAVA